SPRLSGSWRSDIMRSSIPYHFAGSERWRSMPLEEPAAMDLSVQLGRLALKNSILVASGTFGYAQKFREIFDISCVDAIIPKTITPNPRPGNPPPRTVETASGLLNSIGLDNDGIDYFVGQHLPLLRQTGTAVIANIAGQNYEEFVQLAELLGKQSGLAAVELNISCPNVSCGTDYGTD